MTVNIIDEAIKIVREKKKVDFVVKQYQIEQDPYTWGGTTLLPAEQRLKLSASVTRDYQSWAEQIDLDFVIFSRDLLDKSEVDKVIGGDISNYPLADRQILRLAFILYNGIKYGVDREQKIDYIEKGWHPRVVNVSMRYI